MAKINKTIIRKKTTKNIEKERMIAIMKLNINLKTNNYNFTKVSNLRVPLPNTQNNLHTA